MADENTSRVLYDFVDSYDVNDILSDVIMNSELDDLLPSDVSSRQPVLVPQYPKHWDMYPSITPMTTAYGFTVKPERSEKADWDYDKSTNKVFIKPNSVMSLTFSYVPNGEINLYLRVMVVNKVIDFIHLPITRCDNHRSQTITADIQDVPPAHLLKCHHPFAEYVGKENGQTFGDRQAVVVQMSGEESHYDGTMKETMQWQFICNNSCAKGVQRKETYVIFTLENELREIVGRQVMQFKVCGGPKRDMRKEIEARTSSGDTTNPSKRESKNPRKRESKNPRKRKSTEQPMRESKTVSRGKKPCTIVRPTDISAQPVPSAISSRIVRQSYEVTMTMPSKESADHVYECARNAVAGEQLRDVQNGYYEGMYKTIDIGRQSLDKAIPIINSFN